MPSYDSIINKLLEKSEAGAVPWKPTATEDTFIAALEGELTFEIAKLEDGSFEFRMKDQDGSKIIDMACQNPAYGFSEENSYFPKMRRLFEAARMTGLDVDKKLAAAESLLDRV